MSAVRGRFGVLGPVEVSVDGRSVSLGGPKPRALLAALLLEHGRIVSIDRIIDLLWGDDPPPTAVPIVRTYVSGLRRALAAAGLPDALSTRSPGYLLAADPGDIDLAVFRVAVDAARQLAAAGRADRAADGYRAALALWRGPALGGATGAFVPAMAASLEDARLAALAARVDADLALGRAVELVPELSVAVREHPLRERLRAQLMRALAQSGRSADSLASYREGRALLVDELGIEPGPELRRVFEAILAGEPLGLPAALAEPVDPPTPFLLPPDISDFTNRHAELDLLIGRLTGTAAATPLCVVTGRGGTGKSALAVHAAHLLRESYPDGQLFADLRGSEDRPTDAGEVLARFLRALGGTDVVVPTDPEERLELFRMRVAGRRIVIVLDNAADERQVRPLLPGSPTCGVLVTSRGRLVGLAGASIVELAELNRDTAVQMLANVLGSPRVAGDQGAAHEIAALCGGLPLAVRIAGARLLDRPHWPLSRLAARLADERRVLDELAIGDLEVRASVNLSYQALGDLERRAFHLLARVGAPDFAAWLAGPLLGLPVADAEEVVERLVEARMLDVVGVDATGQVRYRFHDLLRAYALEQPEPALLPALARTVRACIGLVEVVAEHEHRAVLRPPLGSRHAADPELDTLVRRDPSGWLVAETNVLVSLVERAGALDLAALTVDLACAQLASALAVRNLFDAWWRTHNAALAAARRAGDRGAEALILAQLGQLRYEQDRFAEAREYYGLAVDAYTEVGDDRGRLACLVGLASVCGECGEFGPALTAYLDAVPLGTRLGDAGTVAQAQYGLGAVYRDQGLFGAALEALASCVLTYRSLGDKRGEGLAVRGVGLVHRALGELDMAAVQCSAARELLVGIGDELGAVYATQALAKVWVRQGRFAAALDALRDGLRTCERMHDRFGTALVLRTMGECQLAARHPAVAEELLTRSLGGWRELGLDLWVARTQRDLGAARAALGDPRGAAALWSAAEVVFTSLGAREAGERPGWPMLASGIAF